MLRPLTGQILLEILPPEETTNGGIHIPETSRDGAPDEKKSVLKGIVRAMGPWKKTKKGFGILPDFGIGAKVVVSPYRGTQVGKYVAERYRLVKSDDILAVLT